MPNKNDDNICLEKIARSKHLTSDKDIILLRYLVNSSRAGKNLKENIIAIEVFGRGSSFDSGSDSIVRSSIYNLRKKLNAYYSGEGSVDPIRFNIPKGSYRVQFENKKSHRLEYLAHYFSDESSKFKILFFISLVLLIILAFFYVRNDDKVKDHTNPIQNPVWAHFIESPNPILIVLGDYFMMQKTMYPDSSLNFIRDPLINSQNEMIDYLEKNPAQKKSLKKLGQSYFGEEIPSCLLQIIGVFKESDKSVKLKYASELSLTDIRENDIIYIGDFGTLNVLNPFFLKTGIRFSTMPPGISIISNQNDTLESILLNNPEQSIFENDYSVVANIEAYEGKKILFLVSFLPFGKKEALYKLNEKSFIAELSDSTTILPNEWTLLMKISGLKSTGFYYEIINFNLIE